MQDGAFRGRTGGEAAGGGKSFFIASLKTEGKRIGSLDGSGKEERKVVLTATNARGKKDATVQRPDANPFG